MKTSYHLGRMSSSDIPLGRDISGGGRLSSISSVAHFFRGDEHGLLSSGGRLWPQDTSSLGVETASGQPPGKLVSSSSEMMMAATSSGIIARMVALRSIVSNPNGLSPQACLCVRDLVQLAEQELLHNPTGPLLSWEVQALWVPLAPQ